MTETSWAKSQRRELCDLFEVVGPDAPTLCGNWTTRDLAAHLIVRESRPEASAGIVLKPLAGWGERVRLQTSHRAWPDLINKVRSGPPVFSGFALPGVDSRLNLTEYFIHLEDVRRAQPTWVPRELDPKLSEALWKTLKARAIGFYRKARVGVRLQRTDADGGGALAHPGSPGVVISGPAQELLLYTFGRKGHAKVAIDGPPEVVAKFATTNLSI